MLSSSPPATPGCNILCACLLSSAKPTRFFLYFHIKMKSSNRSSFLAVVAGPLLLALASFPVADGVCNTYEQDVSVVVEGSKRQHGCRVMCIGCHLMYPNGSIPMVSVRIFSFTVVLVFRINETLPRRRYSAANQPTLIFQRPLILQA